MITERVETIKEGLFKKPKEVSFFTVYHETPAFDGSAYQARFQSSASGSKSIVVAYLYGIINGALSVKMAGNEEIKECFELIKLEYIR